MKFTKIGIYLLLSVVLLNFFVVSPVIAQSENSPQEILEIVSSDFRSQEDVVRSWVNSNVSSDYPDLRNQAQNWLDEGQQKEQNIKEKYNTSEQIIISDNLEIIGYNFDRTNETVTVALQADRSMAITVQDVGSQFSGNRFTWENRDIDAGYTELTLEATESNFNGVTFQALSISDTDAQTGVTIERGNNPLNLWNEVKAWYIPLSGLSGAVMIFVLSIRYISNKEDEGKNDFKPLE